MLGITFFTEGKKYFMNPVNKNIGNKYPIALLIKEAGATIETVKKYYIDPLNQKGIADYNIVIAKLEYNDQGKCPVSLIRKCLKNLLKQANAFGVTTLFVADSAYFKVLTKSRKADPHYGYILPCKIEGYEGLSVVLSLNSSALFYNPQLQSKLEMSLDTLVSHFKGTHQDIGTNIIHSEDYPESLSEITTALQRLHQYQTITCDIETFSLRFNEAGIGTIAFAWNKHEGIAFCVYIYSEQGSAVRQLLREFFLSFTGKIIYHGSTFDINILIYELLM